MTFNQTAATTSHKMRRCLLMAFALIALAITALPTASFAGTDTAGNVLAPPKRWHGAVRQSVRRRG